MITDVAEAIAAALITAGYPAEWLPKPRQKAEDYEQLRVTVIVRADHVDLSGGNRVARLRTYTIDVGYQQHFIATEGAAEKAELVAHETAVNAIIDLLDPADQSTLGGAQIIDLDRYSSDEAPWSMKHMMEMRIYTAVVKVTLEEYREAAA